MRLLQMLIPVFCAAVIAACASTGQKIPKIGAMLSASTGQNGRACVRLGDIRGYGVLQNNVVSIDGARKYYLATVLPGCTDLETSIRVLFSGGFGEICGQSMDRVVTGGDSCTINKIYEFENREQAFATYNAVLEERKALQEQAGQN